MKGVKWKRRCVRVGEKLMLKPTVCLDRFGRANIEPIEGTVVYVNFPHRYFTAEFSFPGGRIRESFKYYTKDDMACAMQLQ